MPFYEYKCSTCGDVATARRTYEQMNDPGPSHCGAPTERIFSPTNLLHVPIAFGYTWSDFHDETEKELARMPDLEPINRARSRPSGFAAKEKKFRDDFYAAAKDARDKTQAIFSNRGEDPDGTG